MLEFDAFLRAVTDRPYEWMTMGCPGFDGDSHESSAHWFGMTMLFDALPSLYKFQFVRLLRKSDKHIPLSRLVLRTSFLFEWEARCKWESVHCFFWPSA